METLSFILGFYTVSTVTGLVLFLTTTYVKQKDLKVKLAQAVQTLKEVESFQKELDLQKSQLTETKDLVNKLALKVGWK